MLKKLLLLTLIWTGTIPAITEDQVKGFSLGTLSAFFGAAALKSKSNQDAAWIVSFGAAATLGLRWYLNKMTPVERIKQAGTLINIAEEVRNKKGDVFPVKRCLVMSEFSLFGQGNFDTRTVSGLLANRISLDAQKLIDKAKRDGHCSDEKLETRISRFRDNGNRSNVSPSYSEEKVASIMAEDIRSRVFLGWSKLPCIYNWRQS